MAPAAGRRAGQAAGPGARPVASPGAGDRRALARARPSTRRPRGCTRPRTTPAGRSVTPGRSSCDGETVALFPDARGAGRRRRSSSGRAGAALDAADPRRWPRGPPTRTRGDLLPEDLYDAWTRGRPRSATAAVPARCCGWPNAGRYLAAADPADEHAHLALIRRLADGGDRRAALRQFERLERASAGSSASRPSARPRCVCATSCCRPSTARPRSRRPAAVSARGSGQRARRASSRLLEVASRRARADVVRLRRRPGSGKTALLAWLGAEADARRMRVGRATAAPIEGAWPYAPVLEALADLCRGTRRCWTGWTTPSAKRSSGRCPVGQFEWDGAERHQRLFVAAAELLRLAAAGAGAVLVSTTRTTPTTPACGCCITWRAARITERVLIVIAPPPDARRRRLTEVRRSLLGRGDAVTAGSGPAAGRDEAGVLVAGSRARGRPRPCSTRIVAGSGGLPFAVVELARPRGRRAAMAAEDASCPRDCPRRRGRADRRRGARLRVRHRRVHGA